MISYNSETAVKYREAIDYFLTNPDISIAKCANYLNIALLQNQAS